MDHAGSWPAAAARATSAAALAANPVAISGLDGTGFDALLAQDFVESFAVQAGREVRILVRPEEIDDLTAVAVLFGPTPSDAPFMSSNTECPGGADTLGAGATGYVGGSYAAGNSGHAARATIRLCTQNGQGGSCTDKTVDFTIP